MSPVTKPSAELRALSDTACIVGVDESDEIGTLPNKSQLTLHLEAISNAVRDAGLKVRDVDGIFTAGQHPPSLLGEALGVTPRIVDGTTVGGCSFIMMVGHAVAALHHHLCDVAVVSHGESGRSQVGVSPRRDTSLTGQFEAPFGFGGAPTYFGMLTTRHMHEYGTTLEQWAQVAVSTRAWAALNPKARNRDPITVADVLASRPVCYPFNLLNICLVTDAGGAVVLTRADRAKDCAKTPVYVRGAGEATEHVMVTQMKNLTQSEATRLSGEKAFAMAGVTPKDFQHVMLYDAFTSGPPLMLEALGFCKPGEGVTFFENGRSTPGGSLPINTNGGGLSYTHSGMYGIFPMIEATRQLRGECGARQVPGVRTSLVNGMGGMLSAAGTLVLSNERGS
jgi:acetyl-CoA acetyltransferase